MDLSNLWTLNFRDDIWVMLVPVCLMVIDFVTGFLNAWAKNRIKSYIMRQGLVKKAGEVVILLVGELLTIGINLPSYVMNFFSIYIILMELISICENLDKMGVPIPKFIKKALNENIDKTKKDEEDKKGR